MEFCRVIEKDISQMSELYRIVFSLSPWNEDWNYNIAFKRLNHFCKTDGFVGIIAKEKDNVLGFAIGNIEPFLHGDIFYLREMCVHPDFQNSGIGSKVINELERTLTELNIKSIYLFTDRKIPAASFYTKHGYALNNDLTIFTKDISFHIIGKSSINSVK